MKIYWYRNSKNLIGHRLHDLRISQHLTQRQLAARMQLAGMEMNEVTILRIEKGVRFVPDYEVAELAKALGVSCDDRTTRYCLLFFCAVSSQTSCFLCDDRHKK